MSDVKPRRLLLHSEASPFSIFFSLEERSKGDPSNLQPDSVSATRETFKGWCSQSDASYSESDGLATKTQLNLSRYCFISAQFHLHSVSLWVFLCQVHLCRSDIYEAPFEFQLLHMDVWLEYFIPSASFHLQKMSTSMLKRVAMKGISISCEVLTWCVCNPIKRRVKLLRCNPRMDPLSADHSFQDESFDWASKFAWWQIWVIWVSLWVALMQWNVCLLHV